MAKLHYRESVTEEEKNVFAKYLAEDEELILATGYGKIYLKTYFLTGIMLPGFIFLIAGLGLAYFLHFNIGIGLLIGLIISTIISSIRTRFLYRANRYLLTTRRVIIKRGLIAVQLTSALYDKITHIEVDQSFSDKIFMHHGTIIVNTAGANKGEITLKYVDYTVEFKNLLERLINRERSQFGMGSTGPVVTLEGEVV